MLNLTFTSTRGLSYGRMIVCHSPALVPDRTSDLLWRLSLRNRVDGKIQCVVCGRVDLLHDALVAVVEHLVRAEAFD